MINIILIKCASTCRQVHKYTGKGISNGNKQGMIVDFKFDTKFYSIMKAFTFTTRVK